MEDGSESSCPHGGCPQRSRWTGRVFMEIAEQGLEKHTKVWKPTPSTVESYTELDPLPRGSGLLLITADSSAPADQISQIHPNKRPSRVFGSL